VEREKLVHLELLGALIICVGICCCGESRELSNEESWLLLDVTLPLLELSEVLEPTPLLCDDGLLHG
jgi:hypothetical protein